MGGTGFSASVLKGLIKKGILTEFQREVSRLEKYKELQQTGINFLSDDQTEAIKNIREGFDQKKVVLIHGITASGKTEIYIHLIEEALRSGKQVLYLVPEIVLTTQIIERLKNVLAKGQAYIIQKYSSHERVEIWRKSSEFQAGDK